MTAGTPWFDVKARAVNDLIRTLLSTNSCVAGSTSRWLRLVAEQRPLDGGTCAPGDYPLGASASAYEAIFRPYLD